MKTPKAISSAKRAGISTRGWAAWAAMAAAAKQTPRRPASRKAHWARDRRCVRTWSPGRWISSPSGVGRQLISVPARGSRWASQSEGALQSNQNRRTDGWRRTVAPFGANGGGRGRQRSRVEGIDGAGSRRRPRGLARPIDGDARRPVWLGQTWEVCGRNILLISAVAGPFVFLSARRLAPTRPSAAGAVLGLIAGAVAATAYGLLHCPEATIAFVATWYTLGVAAAGAAGAIIGRFALRW